MASFKPSQHAFLFCALLGLATPFSAMAQAPGAAPTPAVLNQLWDEASQAFTASNHALAAQKLDELLRLVGNATEGPIEQLRFNLGLAYFLDGKFPEAERAFLDAIRRYPAGEYTSRAHLGVGRARIAQDNKEGAIEALKTAANDPKLRSEAGLSLGGVYTELKREADAAAVFRSLMGSDVRTAQQTAAAVEMLGLMAKSGNLDELVAYLDRLIRQPGIRDAISWYANQVIVQADQLVSSSNYEAALLLYRSVLPRTQILEIQRKSLEDLNKETQRLEALVTSEQSRPLGQRSNAQELLGGLKSTVEAAKSALEAIEKKEDLDAALLMRRGRCLYFLDRFEESMVCFREIRTKYPKSEDLGAAAYAEIVVLNALKKPEEALNRGNDFLRKFPDSPNVEQVASLVIESLSQNNKWGEVIVLSKDLESKFPNSASRDRWAFFQGKAMFNDGQFAESIRQFQKLVNDFPKSDLVEVSLYHIAMAYFMTNDHKGTLAACNEYLKRFPNGTYVGDVLYRLAFVDFNDKQDQSDRILKSLGDYLAKNPSDPAAGSMLVLIGDTWSQKKKGDDAKSEDLSQTMALDAYKKAVWAATSDEVVQYSLESATSIMQARKDWAGIAELHGEFLKRKPDSQLALVSANWLAKMKAREGKPEDAVAMLGDFLKPKIGDPASEQAELLIEQMVTLLVPQRRKGVEIDPDAVEKTVVDALTRVVGTDPNPTANARIYYARAVANQKLKRTSQADLYLKGIALNTDPKNLSPALLRSSGEILLKQGELDKAEAVFQRLADRYKESMFSDAGPVGLGRVALVRNKPDEALKIINEALEKNPGMSSVTEATLAQLQALSALERFDEAEKLALSIVGDKSFRGEKAGLAYLELGQVYRKRAAKQAGAEQRESLAKAHGYYQGVYLKYKSHPDICAEAMWQAYEVLKQMQEDADATDTLRRLAMDPKLENTARAKQAKEIVK